MVEWYNTPSYRGILRGLDTLITNPKKTPKCHSKSVNAQKTGFTYENLFIFKKLGLPSFPMETYILQYIRFRDLKNPNFWTFLTKTQKGVIYT